MGKPLSRFVAGFLAICLISAIAIVILRKDTEPQASPDPVAEPMVVEVEKPAPIVDVAQAPEPAIEETVVEELRFLPDGAAIDGGQESPMLASSPLKKGNRRLSNVRKVSSVDANGPFMAPILSPDGLQIIATRPGYNGVWVMSVYGGDPVLIADVNAYGVEWTADGLIQIPNGDGTTSVYSPDGTLEEVVSAKEDSSPAFVEDDVVFARTADGNPVPLTGNDDRYFGPVASPEGNMVAYAGLQTGLYVAPLDGSGEPVYLGSGTNPRWLPDGGGLVYMRTADDGHDLTEGDIVYVTPDLTEESILTGDDDGIYQNPSPGPDGSTIIYEGEEGDIYVGNLN